MDAVNFKNVTYIYDEKPVIDNLALSIEVGSWTQVRGKNGCGKSTFAKLAAGLIGPTSGEIDIFGENSILPNNNFRKTTSIVLQNFEMQIFHSIVRDDLAFGPENIGMSYENIQATVNEVAKICAIEDILDAEIFTLSGGQKQMVAFAGAIATNPKLLILDESSSHMDDNNSKIFYKILEEMKQKRTTIIEINHLDTISKNVDEIIDLSC